MKRRIAKALLKAGAAVAGVVAVVALFFIAAGWQAFGQGATGARLERMKASPQWHDGHFANTQAMFMDPNVWSAMVGASDVASPEATKPVPAQKTNSSTWAAPPATGLRVTWFGHASTLVELDGQRILTDPAFGPRASPFDFIGPQRWFDPVNLDDLGAVDAVVISHDHHDHLQYSSVRLLKDKPVTWFVPLGVGAHLEYWGVDPARIVELDWWQKGTLKGDGKDKASVDVNCVPARHASGRQLLDQGATLWASWAFVSKGVGAGEDGHRVFFSGDTGLHEAMRTIGEKLGPFDLTMIEVGQYHPTWPDWHIGPEQAVKAHQLLRGKVMLPIHWALWTLAPHGWTEPGERALAAATAAGVTVALPEPGQPFEPLTTTSANKWWPDEPWTTGAQQPIVSTIGGDPNARMP